MSVREPYDGPVAPGMVFTAPDNEGVLGHRRVRVIARAHDSDDLILEEMPGRIRYVQVGAISRCPEANLRIVFQPEKTPEGDWRDSEVVKQARRMLVEVGTPLWPGLTESDWAEVLRGVLAERDMIGAWLQSYLDAEP